MNNEDVKMVTEVISANLHQIFWFIVLTWTTVNVLDHTIGVFFHKFFHNTKHLKQIACRLAAIAESYRHAFNRPVPSKPVKQDNRAKVQPQAKK